MKVSGANPIYRLETWRRLVLTDTDLLHVPNWRGLLRLDAN